jgi:hypothetical protein
MLFAYFLVSKFSTMMMEAVRSSEKAVNYFRKRWHSHRCENLKLQETCGLCLFYEVGQFREAAGQVLQTVFRWYLFRISVGLKTILTEE